MNKIITLILLFGLAITGCSTPQKKETTVQDTQSKIKVAAHTSPMLEILEIVKEELNKENIELEIVKVSDNVQANVILKDKEVDANFFQHSLFMESFNKGNDANLVVIQPVYDAIVSYYSKTIEKIEDTPENSTVAIPSDPTNMTRALRLLAKSGLIKLADSSSYEVDLSSIVENEKNLQFTPVSLLNLNEAYQEKDLVFNYPAYAAKISLTPADNGLILEDEGDLTFAISLIAREDNKDLESIKALKKAITSEKVKQFIETTLKGHAKVAF